MKKVVFILLLSSVFSVGAFAQTKSADSTKAIPADFKSDGCTWFPDGDYRNCCVEHDTTYYFGGSWSKRWRADKSLYKCVADKKGFQHKIIAPVMWLGVRIGGISFLPTPFRWGFGKDKMRQADDKQNQKKKSKK